MGDKPRSIDVSAYALLSHLVTQPMEWEGTGYIEGKENLGGWMGRMKGEIGT